MVTATETIVDIESLTLPIPGEFPCGSDQRYTGVHDRIREARRSDDSFNRGEWVRDLKTADWRLVTDLSVEALTNLTKDLQISGWLAEALAHRNGFAGIRDGLTLVRLMLETYWDGLFPEAPEGDLEARSNAVAWLDRELGDIVGDIALTSSPIGEDCSYRRWEEAIQFEIPPTYDNLSYEERRAIDQKIEVAAREGKITGDRWRKARDTTSLAFFETVLAETIECQEARQRLDETMDGLFGGETPGLGNLGKMLGNIRDLLERIVKEKRPAEAAPVAGDTKSEESAMVEETFQPGGSDARFSGPIKTRPEALRLLSEVAEFFRRTEPHSPVSYLVQRAVRWGNLPLEAWLGEVIKNDDVLNGIRETLGIRSNGAEG